jgi:glutaredoxin-like protein
MGQGAGGRQHHADPDGNGDFTQGMGMLVDKSDLGFGKRSWRYSMLVRDGVVEKMFIEPEKEGDPFEVSDADTMLRYVAPQAVAPEPITIFTKPGCPFCAKAKAMLDEAGFTYEEIPLSHGITSSTLQAVAGAGTAPQVFAGGKKIGGSEDLQAWLKESQAKPDCVAATVSQLAATERFAPCVWRPPRGARAS